MKKEHLTSEIIKASKSIRKKQLAMKMGRSEEQNLLEKHFKPLTEPLQKILQTGAIKREIETPKMELQSKEETYFPSPVQKTPVIPLTEPETPVIPLTEPKTPARRKTPSGRRLAETEIEYTPFTEEEEQQISTEKSFQQFRDEYQTMIDKNPKVVDEFLEQYAMTPRVYIDGLLSDTEGEYDTTTGVHFDPVTSQLKLGRAVLEIDGNDIVLDGLRYKGTAGLYELIFKNRPQGYTKHDEERYQDILKRTNVHHRDYDPSKQIRGNKGYKYTHVIKPLTFRSRASTVSGSTGGRGHALGSHMSVSSAPYQFVYWDDINELVDRLKLLVASEQAGHTGHSNEIASIIEELKEAEVIY